MLYNQNWNKPDIHSLAGLIQWLETKDPQQTYRYSDSRHCMCAQYYKAMGYWFVRVNTDGFDHGFLKYDILPNGFNYVAVHGEPTFGAALRRARALVSA